MVLDRYRAAADKFLTPVAVRLIKVNPDTISWTGVTAAIGAGVGFFLGGPGFLSVALVLLLLSSYLDALDGKFAKLAVRTSARGDFLDHLLARYAHVFLIGGVAFSAHCQPFTEPRAVVGVLLTSYMGT